MHGTVDKRTQIGYLYYIVYCISITIITIIISIIFITKCFDDFTVNFAVDAVLDEYQRKGSGECTMDVVMDTVLGGEQGSVLKLIWYCIIIITNITYKFKLPFWQKCLCGRINIYTLFVFHMSRAAPITYISKCEYFSWHQTNNDYGVEKKISYRMIYIYIYCSL